MRLPYLLWAVAAFFLVYVNVNATHLRAGDITAERISTTENKYRITVTLYIKVGNGVAEQPNIVLIYGDGFYEVVNLKSQTPATNPETAINIYQSEHTYGAPGNYVISIGSCVDSGDCKNIVKGIQNRNAGILNMDNSVETPFYIETYIKIDPTLPNSTPVLLNPPIDKACSGQRYTYNPAAFDLDGDSLSYKFVIPSQGNTVVAQYRYPNNTAFGGIPESGGGSAVFTLNPITGLVTFDSPGQIGEYNFAFIVEEWRNGIRIGFVRRDMQILVQDCLNKRPTVIIPSDTCVVAGALLNKIIKATDPDIPLQKLSITSYGGVYESSFPSSIATFTFLPDQQVSTATGTFNWQTGCQHVRYEPYTIVFKAEDFPTPDSQKLTDTKAWLVTVIGPKPTGLTATPLNKSVRLNWTNYLGAQCAGAEEIVIYRKKGCDSRTPGPCEIGVPDSWGYEEIGRVPASTTTFLDNNGGKGLPKGIKYSYRIVAEFPSAVGAIQVGQSFSSDESCVALSKDVPFITNVSIEKTSKTTGEIFVRWTHPLEFDASIFPPPYVYKVLRTEGTTPTQAVESTIYTAVKTINVSQFPTYPRTGAFVGNVADTTFTDTNLNTDEKIYAYSIVIYFGAGTTVKDTSTAASSVRLGLAPIANGLQLDWTYDVPWNNINQEHYIYRKVNGVFEKIDSIFVSNDKPTYKDLGTYKNIKLVPDSTYCYFVETQGKYDDFTLNVKTFLNKSQEACKAPLDTTKPCPPVLALDQLDCAQFLENIKLGVPVVLENNLSWQNLFPPGCDHDIASYRVYYAAYKGDSLKFIGATNDTTYKHFNTIGSIISLAGCYAVTAVDRSGNESIFSNIVCVDNCPYYELPNVITPKTIDNLNDKFRPFREPSFVESVDFKVYNRWGKQVFKINNDIYLNWDGSMGAGESDKNDVSNGIYFYSAEVRFIRLNRGDSVVKLKGWIHILK